MMRVLSYIDGKDTFHRRRIVYMLDSFLLHLFDWYRRLRNETSNRQRFCKLFQILIAQKPLEKSPSMGIDIPDRIFGMLLSHGLKAGRKVEYFYLYRSIGDFGRRLELPIGG